MGLIRHPALMLAGAWVALLVFSQLRRGTVKDSSDGPSWIVGGSIAVVASYVAIVIWYTLQASYFDAAEPTITAVAAAFTSGLPLYPALDAPERYAHIYGPLLFIVHAGAFAAGGMSIIVSKSVGSIAAVLSLVVTWTVYNRRAGAAAAFHVTAVAVLVYLYFSNVTFWTRSDPLLIACTAVGLSGALAGRSWAAALAVGLAAGAAVNLKVTGGIYLIPVVVLATAKHGVRVVSATAAIGAVAAAVPFLIPKVSLVHYFDYLRLSARNGLLVSKLSENAEWSVVLLTPLLVTWWGVSGTRLERETRHFLSALIAAVVVIAIVSAKPGGGAFHLMPFVPILGYAAVAVPRGTWNGSAAVRLAVALALSVTAIAVPRQLIFIRTVVERHLESAIADARAFADETSSKRVAIGYSGTSHLSHARPEFVFRTGDYLIDAPAVQEHRLSGLEIPAATTRAIDDCRFDYWLIPRTMEPFDVPSAYQPIGPAEVFPEEFRSAFKRRYARVGHTALFDVWECRRPGSGATN